MLSSLRRLIGFFFFFCLAFIPRSRKYFQRCLLARQLCCARIICPWRMRNLVCSCRPIILASSIFRLPFGINGHRRFYWVEVKLTPAFELLWSEEKKQNSNV